jgi:hypothetical protein
MSHWAEIDETNTVIRVLVGDNNESDEGKAIIESLGGTWVQTSYTGKIRYNFAGIGYTYDSIDDAFIAPIPICGHEELKLNNNKRWECAGCDELAKIMQSGTTA